MTTNPSTPAATDSAASPSTKVNAHPAAGRVHQLLRGTDVWDMTLPWAAPYWNIDTLRRFHRAGFTFISLTAQDIPPTFQGILQMLSQLKADYQAHDWLTFPIGLGDIDRARARGKLALTFNVQDTVQIGSDLSRVQSLRDAGVWHMLLAYQTRNLVAGGCADTADAGLSDFGRQLIKEMNRVGMVIDCSHTGRRSSLAAMETSAAPVIFSHSNAYAICANIRNIHDDQIKACAATGGVIGIVGIGAFLGDPQARVESLWRHIDHIASLVGPEHIGIGTDYVKDMESLWRAVRPLKEALFPDPTGTQLYEGGCFQPEQLPDLIECLLAHGYSDRTVAGILGGNFRRVFRAILSSDMRAEDIGEAGMSQ